MTESVDARPTEAGKRDVEAAAGRAGTAGQISAEVDRIIGQRLDSLVAMRIESVVESIYAGPMPPPDILQGYEDTIPGAAERLLAEFESQAQHRRKLEDRTNRASVEVQKRGQWMAYSLSLLVVLLGGGLILSGTISPGWPR